MKLLVFGTGEYYERFKKWIAKEEIVALIDNSSAKQHKLLDGVEILSPEEGITREYEVIVVMSFYIKEMKKQLLDLGVAEEKIYHFYDLRKLVSLEKYRQQIQYYGITEQELKKGAETQIGLLSTDLALGGTAIALFHMAEVLKRCGYSVVFASMMDGPLRAYLEEQGIPVIIDSNLQLATMCETRWAADFCLIICNAINYYIFLSERDLSIPIIWWLHDSAFFYDGVDRTVIKKISKENLTTLSVGPVPKQAIQTIVPQMPVGLLLYGVQDRENFNGVKERLNEKVCFVTIGYIEERKGQDILLQALRLLETAIRRQASFYLIGQDTSLLAEQIREEAKEIPEIIITGPVGREEINTILLFADVMVCPSREDPMPTVAAEAMSYGVPCIVSNVTGTAEYITEQKNGLIFEKENAEMLAKKIRWCIENRASLNMLGREARKTYEDVFSMEEFEKEVRHIVCENLGK